MYRTAQNRMRFFRLRVALAQRNAPKAAISDATIVRIQKSALVRLFAPVHYHRRRVNKLLLETVARRSEIGPVAWQISVGPGFICINL